jgi:hypothetical protein
MHQAVRRRGCTQRHRKPRGPSARSVPRPRSTCLDQCVNPFHQSNVVLSWELLALSDGSHGWRLLRCWRVGDRSLLASEVAAAAQAQAGASLPGRTRSIARGAARPWVPLGLAHLAPQTRAISATIHPPPPVAAQHCTAASTRDLPPCPLPPPPPPPYRGPPTAVARSSSPSVHLRPPPH